MKEIKEQKFRLKLIQDHRVKIKVFSILLSMDSLVLTLHYWEEGVDCCIKFSMRGGRGVA